MRKIISGHAYDTQTCHIIERHTTPDGVGVELCITKAKYYFLHIFGATGTAMAGYDIHRQGLCGEWVSPCTLDEGMDFLQDFKARYTLWKN